jgi:hypothetical protein
MNAPESSSNENRGTASENRMRGTRAAEMEFSGRTEVLRRCGDHSATGPAFLSPALHQPLRRWP